MSASLWRYTSACDAQACPGDCDVCSYEPDDTEIIHCRECRFAKPKSVKIGEPTRWTCRKYDDTRFGGEFCSRGEARAYTLDAGETYSAGAGEG